MGSKLALCHKHPTLFFIGNNHLSANKWGKCTMKVEDNLILQINENINEFLRIVETQIISTALFELNSSVCSFFFLKQSTITHP